jgi:uncharacterized protein YehS (DUF1456 family)
MTNNDLLRRLRYALNLNGETIAELCTLGGHEIRPIDVLKLLKKGLFRRICKRSS